MRIAPPIAVLLTALLLGVFTRSLPAQEPEIPSWKWTEDQWRGAVERVRAGKSLAPKVWPGGARVAVALSFDFDNETPSLRDNQTSPSLMSNGQYGHAALFLNGLRAFC